MQHSYGQYKAGFGSAGLDKYKSYPASPAVMQHSYGQYKAGFGSAGLDKYKSYPASPAVMDNTRQGLEVHILQVLHVAFIWTIQGRVWKCWIR